MPRRCFDASSFDAHRAWGEILGALSVVLLILAPVARASRRIVLETLLLAVLVEVAQHGLAAVGDSNKWLGGLHALDGVVILLLGIVLFGQARGRTLSDAR
jgi:Family of unknown function (DUF6220)